MSIIKKAIQAFTQPHVLPWGLTLEKQLAEAKGFTDVELQPGDTWHGYERRLDTTPVAIPRWTRDDTDNARLRAELGITIEHKVNHVYAVCGSHVAATDYEEHHGDKDAAARIAAVLVAIETFL